MDWWSVVDDACLDDGGSCGRRGPETCRTWGNRTCTRTPYRPRPSLPSSSSLSLMIKWSTHSSHEHQISRDLVNTFFLKQYLLIYEQNMEGFHTSWVGSAGCSGGRRALHMSLLAGVLLRQVVQIEGAPFLPPGMSSEHRLVLGRRFTQWQALLQNLSKEHICKMWMQ
jgi:hypothetical protein